MLPKDKRDSEIRKSIIEFENIGQYWRLLATGHFDGEVWNGVVGWEDKYQVSNLGRIRSIRRNNQSSGQEMGEPYILKQFVGSTGYLNVQLRDIGRNKRLKLHRAVAESFNDNPFNLPVVNHLDWNKLNNKPDNLQWSTKKDDVLHAFDNKLIGRGENSYEASISNEVALNVFNATGLYREIAEKFNVDISVVTSIKNGYSWTSVTGKVREAKTRGKLTKEEAILILLDRRNLKEISSEYSVLEDTIRKIKTGKKYTKYTCEHKDEYVNKMVDLRKNT